MLRDTSRYTSGILAQQRQNHKVAEKLNVKIEAMYGFCGLTLYGNLETLAPPLLNS